MPINRLLEEPLKQLQKSVHRCPHPLYRFDAKTQGRNPQCIRSARWDLRGG
jgi:hypothetical protein